MSIAPNDQGIEAASVSLELEAGVLMENLGSISHSFADALVGPFKYLYLHARI